MSAFDPRQTCKEARRAGFTGKMVIHPAPVAVMNEEFTPTATRIQDLSFGLLKSSPIVRKF